MAVVCSAGSVPYEFAVRLALAVAVAVAVPLRQGRPVGSVVLDFNW